VFNQIPEKQMHYVRWLLTLGWAVLIGSMFYDPLTTQLTKASNWWSPFHIGTDCIQFQGTCLQPEPYDMGARIFWGMIIPSAIVLIFLFGHEAWRRICPLSFIAQLPRALGLQHKRLTIKPTGDFSYEPVKVSKDSWLGRNYLYLQFFLLFLGLNIRLLLVNSDCLALGIYLVSTILLAMGVNYWYGGKSWCHYICPMAPVQIVYTGPRGLLGSKPYQEKTNITQSMCRTVDGAGKEKSACVGCKSSCLDIDIEKSYWEEIHQPDRKLLYYGYFGLIIGFYLYFFLYSGDVNFFAAGSWREVSQLETLFNPGFYIANKVIPIPKIVAVPLTLSVCTGLSYGAGLLIEKIYKRNVKSSNTAHGKRRIFRTFTKVQHRIFTALTFLSFNALFFLGIYPSFAWLPPAIEKVLTWLVVIASAAWCYRTLKRSEGQYVRESRVNSLRRRLDQLTIDFPKVLEGRSLEELTAEEVYVLGKIVPDLIRDKELLEAALRQEEAEHPQEPNHSAQRKTLEKINQALESRQTEALALPPPPPSKAQVELYSVSSLEILQKEFLFLDMLLKELLGPIGPLLLRHTAPQTSSLQELIQKLNAHIPLEKLAEFQCKTIPLLQMATIQSRRKFAQQLSRK
jgi:hypothetical protein